MGKESTCVADEGLQSKPDTDHLGFASSNDYVFVTADTKIKVRKHERAALQSASIKVVEVIFPKTYSLWDRFELLVKKWPEIEELLAREEYVVVRPRSVKPLRQDLR